MIRACLIDDDYDITSILKGELEAGCDDVRITRIAHNVEDAKRTIDSFLPLIDCFIIDIAMPASARESQLQRDAGFQVLAYLRHTKRFTGTVIMLTSSCEFEDGKRAFGAGCDVYLCKTRELPDLIDAINFSLQRRLATPELQHFFLPEEITAREARMMEMLHDGAGWQDIARTLRFGNAGAARIAAEDAFNKLLSWHAVTPPLEKKREVAMQLWKWRHLSHAPSFDGIEHPHRDALSADSH